MIEALPEGLGEPERIERVTKWSESAAPDDWTRARMRKQRADFFVRPSAAIAGVLVTGVGLVLALVTYSFLALKDERYADAIRPFDLGRMTLARRIGQMVVVGPLMTTGLVHPLLSFRAH